MLNVKFDGEPVYGDNDKYIKTKIKIYDGNENTNFPDKKVAKDNSSYKCLSLIMLDSVVKVKKNYYPKTLLEECKHEIKKTNALLCIIRLLFMSICLDDKCYRFNGV